MRRRSSIVHSVPFLLDLSHPTAFLDSLHPSTEGAAGTDKEEHVSRYAFYAKLVGIILVLTVVGMALGVEPWGPG